MEKLCNNYNCILNNYRIVLVVIYCLNEIT